MEENLFLVCMAAFAAVLVLLSLFALVMRALLVLFPEREAATPSGRHGGVRGVRPAAAGKTDAAMVAAIDSAAAAIVPGGRVTRIEETTGRKS